MTTISNDADQSRMPELKILLLEDSAIDAELIRSRLEAGGLTGAVRHVTSGAAFAQALASCAYDAILSDYDLPDIDGMTALRKSLEACPDAPFIFVSGKLGEDAAVQSLQQGATDYVVKTRLDRLLPAVRRALHESAERRKRKEAEQALRETENRIRESLERTLEAERVARREAEHVSRMKDEFLATLSHELRTPLSAILGWAQLVQRKVDDRPEVSAALQVIERNARAQARLIEDLLDMSRIISGKVLLNVDAVDIGLVAHAALDVATPTAEARTVRLVDQISPAAGCVMGDASRLQQVLWNLLSNAVKFTPAGGTVTLRVRRHGSNVEVSVTDTGIGIRAEFLPFIFERFRQADSSLTRSVGGLGLGLSIVKHLVELHGGTVSGASDGEGKGAMFTVTLPIAQTPGRMNPREPGTPLVLDGIAKEVDREISGHEQLDGLRLVIVDDELDTRTLLKQIFAGRGAEVEAAGSAQEGRDAIARLRPHVLISDIGMPGEDGYSFVRSFTQQRRANGTKPTMIAIALTAFARPADRARAIESGFDAHVTKPIDIDGLVSMVARLASAAGLWRTEGEVPAKESSCSQSG